MEEFDYSSHPNIVYPSLSWINDAWNDIADSVITDRTYIESILERSLLNLKFDVWKLLSTLYSRRLYTVFDIILDYLDKNDIETKFTGGLVDLWANVCKDAPIQFLERLLDIIFVTVPAGYKVIFKHIPDRGADFIREYLGMLEDFNQIPNEYSEKIWLFDLLKQYPFVVIDFVKKHNIKLVWNKSDIVDLIDRFQSRKISVEEFSEILRVLGIRTESFIAELRAFMSYNRSPGEDLLTYIVFRNIQFYGRPPLPNECVTHQDLDNFKISIESGDEEGIKEFFKKIEPFNVDGRILVKEIIPQLHVVLRKDNVHIFKLLMDYITIDSFYAEFLRYAEVICTYDSYKIGKYLLSEWENSSYIKINFWNKVKWEAYRNRNWKFLDLIRNYEEFLYEDYYNT